MAAIPVILGYVAIGLPCGILSSSMGLSWLQTLLLSLVFYSGAGQFMIPNMFIAGASLLSVIASVSFVNTRQMLYSAALIPWCKNEKIPLIFWYMVTVTDETFGIAVSKYKEGDWSIGKSIFLNEFSHISWTASTVVGCLLGPIINIPIEIASFAMTSIFICLLVSSIEVKPNLLAAFGAIVGVIACKVFSLGGFSIFVGAIIGVIVGYVYATKFRNSEA